MDATAITNAVESGWAHMVTICAALVVIKQGYDHFDTAKRLLSNALASLAYLNNLLLHAIIRTSGRFGSWVLRVLGFGIFLIKPRPDNDPNGGGKRHFQPFSLRIGISDSVAASPSVRLW